MVTSPDINEPSKVGIISRLMENDQISFTEANILLTENGTRYALPFSTIDFTRLQLSLKPEKEIFRIISEKHPELLRKYSWGQIEEITKIILDISK